MQNLKDFVFIIRLENTTENPEMEILFFADVVK